MPKNDHNQLEELQNKINKIMAKWKSYSHNDVIEKADTLIQKYPGFKEHIEKGRDKVLEQKKEKQKAEQSTGQEQKMTSSSTTNQDQSQIKETGAVPKKRRERDEEYFQKERGQMIEKAIQQESQISRDDIRGILHIFFEGQAKTYAVNTIGNIVIIVIIDIVISSVRVLFENILHHALFSFLALLQFLLFEIDLGLLYCYLSFFCS